MIAENPRCKNRKAAKRFPPSTGIVARSWRLNFLQARQLRGRDDRWAGQAGWLTGFEPAISRSTIGPDEPTEQTPNPYAISILALSSPFARGRMPSRVFAGKRGIPGVKTVAVRLGCRGSSLRYPTDSLLINSSLA